MKKFLFKKPETQENLVIDCRLSVVGCRLRSREGDLRRGQAMIMTILALGGTMLGATTIAGLLMVYQIRQSTDMANSVKAIYAADAGIEYGLYNYFSATPYPAPSFVDGKTGASTTMQCWTNNKAASANCADYAAAEVVEIRSVGRNGNVSRAFRIEF